VVVFEKGGVAVDLAAEALAQDQFGMGDVEVGVKVCARSALDAVIGPEGLRAVGDFGGGEGRGTGVGRSERDVAGGVPVLGEDDVLEALAEAVDEGDDLVTIFDGERAAGSIDGGAEVVLDVDHEECVAGQEVHYC